MADYVKRNEAGEKQGSLEVISFPSNSSAQGAFTFSGIHWIHLNLV